MAGFESGDSGDTKPTTPPPVDWNNDVSTPAENPGKNNKPQEPAFLDFADKKAEATLDRNNPSERSEYLTPAQFADHLKKNNGLGPRGSQERSDSLAELEGAMSDQLNKGGDALKKYVADVNKALAGSGLSLSERTSSGSKDHPNSLGGHTTQTDMTSSFQIKNGGRTIDGTMISAKSQTDFDKTGNAVSGRTTFRDEVGSPGGGWGTRGSEGSSSRPAEPEESSPTDPNSQQRGGKGGGKKAGPGSG